MAGRGGRHPLEKISSKFSPRDDTQTSKFWHVGVFYETYRFAGKLRVAHPLFRQKGLEQPPSPLKNTFLNCIRNGQTLTPVKL